MSYSKEQAKALIESLYANENGVSEDSHNHLHDLIVAYGLEEDFRGRIDATDGAFYIVPEDYDSDTRDSHLLDDDLFFHRIKTILNDIIDLGTFRPKG